MCIDSADRSVGSRRVRKLFICSLFSTKLSNETHDILCSLETDKPKLRIDPALMISSLDNVALPLSSLIAFLSYFLCVKNEIRSLLCITYIVCIRIRSSCVQFRSCGFKRSAGEARSSNGSCVHYVSWSYDGRWEL